MIKEASKEDRLSHEAATFAGVVIIWHLHDYIVPYGASDCMITPFTIVATPPEVPWETTTLRERAKTRTWSLTRSARAKDHIAMTLNEYGVYVRRPVWPDLFRSNGPLYEDHILPRKGNAARPWGEWIKAAICWPPMIRTGFWPAGAWATAAL